MQPVMAAFIVQWILWRFGAPLCWFIFYPAVFFSSWIGGLRVGLLATAISAVLVCYFFLPPEWSWPVSTLGNVFSIAVFVSMGVVFSLFHDNLRKVNQQVVGTLAAVNAANERLE
jgi:K+-sensing histidine kinase KdpD